MKKIGNIKEDALSVHIMIYVLCYMYWYMARIVQAFYYLATPHGPFLDPLLKEA